MALVNIALGSNIGSPVENLESAVREIAKLGQVLAKSSLYSTKPWGIKDQPDFVNAVIQIETKLTPRNLLTDLKEIERRMGRGEGVRWGPRLIDLDILTYENESVDEPGLTVPHPRMAERAFVLIPLCDVDSTYVSKRDLLPAESLAEVKLLQKAWCI